MNNEIGDYVKIKSVKHDLNKKYIGKIGKISWRYKKYWVIDFPPGLNQMAFEPEELEAV